MVCRSLVLIHCIHIKSNEKIEIFPKKIERRNRIFSTKSKKISIFFEKIEKKNRKFSKKSIFCSLLLHRTYFGPRFVFIWTEDLHEVLEYDFTLECQQLLFAALFPKKLPVRPFTVPHTLLLQQPAGRSAVHFAIQNTPA